MIDNRPPNNTSSVNNCSEAIKGTFDIADSNSKWNSANDGKSANEDFLSINIEDSSRPRSITLDIKENNHMFGFFKVFALPKNISLSPDPMLDIKVPILNSPSGKQVGRFRISGAAQLNISFPNGKPSCWFGDESKDNQTSLSINSHEIGKSTDFDCPCGETNALDSVNYEITQEDGVGSVTFDIRVNTDIAFVPKNAEVSIELVENDVVISSQDVFSNPSLKITDDNSSRW
ncbi:MAG: hypothetical protein R2883_04505 [Caldisericia bacterium]